MCAYVVGMYDTEDKAGMKGNIILSSKYVKNMFYHS